MPRIKLLATIGLPLAIIGCGSSSHKSSSSTSPAASQSAAGHTASGSPALAVTETEYRLSPSTPRVTGGAVQVTVKNSGAITHALEIENAGPGGKDLRSADIQPGGTTTLTARLQAGKTYEWYCPIDGHKGLGMKGTITVQ